MPLFEKRPVQVEARLVTKSALRSIVDWINDAGGVCSIEEESTAIDILTLEGEMRARDGDWVICGVQGEFYPCKPEIFEATYRLVT